MADITSKSTTHQMKASGVAGLFGLFAGLCAIFAGGVGLSDWRDETAQSHWPVISAVVERTDVMTSVRALKDGGGKKWHLSARLSFNANGEAQTATLYSRTVYSESEAASLQHWAAQHRKGSHIEIRYDPSQPDRAVFASPEPGFTSGRTRTDLVLFAIAAVASAGLIWLARFLNAREARAAPVARDPQRSMLAFGALFAAMGLLLTGLALYGAVHAEPFTADRLMGMPAGLMFLFAGILLALPPAYAKWRGLLATLVITCFALTFDWVAFGPGERRFTGNIGGIGFISDEMTGRIFFGVFAVVLDICAVAMWIGQCRQTFRPTAPTASPGDSTA